MSRYLDPVGESKRLASELLRSLEIVQPLDEKLAVLQTWTASQHGFSENGRPVDSDLVLQLAQSAMGFSSQGDKIQVLASLRGILARLLCLCEAAKIEFGEVLDSLCSARDKAQEAGDAPLVRDD